MNVHEFVATLDQTINDRGQQYGPVLQNIERIALLVSILTGSSCDPLLVVKVLVAVKLSRLAQDDGHLDSVVDLAGYSAIWAELISEPAALKDQPTGV